MIFLSTDNVTLKVTWSYINVMASFLDLNLKNFDFWTYSSMALLRNEIDKFFFF